MTFLEPNQRNSDASFQAADPQHADHWLPATEDVLCPQCSYNLRGLPGPLCPECGLIFKWPDVLAAHAEAKTRRQRRKVTIVAVILGIGMTLPCLVNPDAGAFLSLGFLLAAGVIFALTALHAAIQYVPAYPLIRSPTWRAFRAWWEAVILADAIVAMIYFAAGHPLVFDASIYEFHVVRGHWTLLILAVAAAAAAHGWTLQRRCRQWEILMTPRRLWASVVLAKVASLTLWVVLDQPAPMV